MRKYIALSGTVELMIQSLTSGVLGLYSLQSHGCSLAEVLRMLHFLGINI